MKDIYMNTVQDKWASFCKEMPHQHGAMAKRNWGHPWHSMCSYQGKLKPAIANALISTVLPNDRSCRVLDPFSGVGTIPFEGKLAGHEALGFDISPAAVIISRAKLSNPDLAAVKAVMNDLGQWIEDRRDVEIPTNDYGWLKFNGPLQDYFNPQTFREILLARQYFMQNPPVTGDAALVMACLLHILHGNRPYALSRRSHPITPFAPTGPDEYRSLLERLSNKVKRVTGAIPDTGSAPPGVIFNQDITSRWPDKVDNLDAIITSPPFFDSTRFHSANWMRLWMAGWGVDDFSTKPRDFVDERQKKGFEIYDAVFKQSADRLNHGGVMVLHLGKSKKCDMASILSEIGRKYLRLEDSFSESVSHCESHGIRDKGTVTHHQYLLFTRL